MSTHTQARSAGLRTSRPRRRRPVVSGEGGEVVERAGDRAVDGGVPAVERTVDAGVDLHLHPRHRRGHAGPAAAETVVALLSPALDPRNSNQEIPPSP
jgi:hypothetical protein